MKHLITGILTLLTLVSFGQITSKIIAGPMVGHTELRTAEVWVEFAADVKQATLSFQRQGSISTRAIKVTLPGGEFNTLKFILTGLEPGSEYAYSIMIDNANKAIAQGNVTTQSLWQHRKPAPDFSFLTGSCSYFNEPKYDRSNKPYGGDSSIFVAMAKENAAFALWLGDNWYTREADYFSKWGLHYRASRDRSVSVLQPFLRKMPHYAIWDDHDYGPNDADKSFILKETARDVFMKYWSNPSYGMEGKGVYTKLTWNDVDVFMMDDRWFRSPDATPDSVGGKINANKKMFGDEQMEWLKNNLLVSNSNYNISFRIIATGSQVLNGYSPNDCFRHFPAEYNDLITFLEANKIKGVLFLTGDRHHSEIIKLDRSATYPLYDITVSPLTAGVAKTRGKEVLNPARVGSEIDEQNYGRIIFSGKGEARTLTVEFVGVKGEKIGSWSVMKSDLK